MSRPLKYQTGPIVAVSIDGVGASWCNRIFASPAKSEIAEMARTVARTGLTYAFRRCQVTADASTPLGAMAALAAYSPGRAIIVQAPDSVYEFLARGMTHV